MANKLSRLFSRSTNDHIDQLFVDNGDGSYSQSVVNTNKTTKVAVEFTRANNATAYAVGDVVSASAGTPAVYELPNIMRVNGGSGTITNVRVIVGEKSLTPQFRVHFFNASDPTISGDNLPHKEKYVDVVKRLGYIDLPAATTGADTTNSDMSRAVSSPSSILPVVAASASKSLWVLLETLSVVTFAAQDKISIVVTVAND